MATGLLRRMNSCGNALYSATRAHGFRVWACLCLMALGMCSPRAGAEDAVGTNTWSFAFPYTLPLNITLCTPAVGQDGTIYIGCFDGEFFAVAPDGKEKWQFQAGREVKSSPAIADDGTIYFGSRDRQFYALTAEGKLKWKYATGAWVDSSPAIAADGTVYFGSWDKNFYALNPAGGLKWKFATGAVVDSSPAIASDGTIYFGSHDKKFYALDPDGKVRWTFATEAEVTSSPAIGDDGTIYFTSTDGNLYHLKADGTELWRCRIGGGSDGSPILAANGNIFISAGNRQVAVSPAGSLVWQWGSPIWVDQTPAAAEGYVCFAQPWRMLMARDADGGAAWIANVFDNPSSSPVIGAAGEIYFCAGNRLMAVQAPIPQLPAKSGWPMFRGNARHTGRAAN
jgi:outer membrane protein assembly factor BamB